jgi:hypothetical protein
MGVNTANTTILHFWCVCNEMYLEVVRCMDILKIVV